MTYLETIKNYRCISRKYDDIVEMLKDIIDCVGNHLCSSNIVIDDDPMGLVLGFSSIPGISHERIEEIYNWKISLVKLKKSLSNPEIPHYELNRFAELFASNAGRREIARSLGCGKLPWENI